MWDKAAAERYEAWYATPRGAFALAREQRLMADMISPWQRRNHTFLEIACGAGHFLEMFYDGGFDVTGVDKSEAMLEKARERMGCRATLRQSDAVRLPFDDDDFDYVAIITALECMENPRAALSEAFRVARRGVVIAYLNSWSVYRQEQRLARVWRRFRQAMVVRRAVKRGSPPPEPERKHALDSDWFNPFSLWRLVWEVSGKRPSAFRSTLFSPSFCWRGVKSFSLSWAQLLPLGAVSVVRVDLMPVAATATLLRTSPIARTQATRATAGATVSVMDSSSRER